MSKQTYDKKQRINKVAEVIADRTVRSIKRRFPKSKDQQNLLERVANELAMAWLGRRYRTQKATVKQNGIALNGIKRHYRCS